MKGPGEPTFALADELAARVRDGGLDVVVGIGGGSALDVAKAARIVADQGGSAADYAGGTRVPAPPQVGLVLCPTTSGTGSEVSGASVLTDTDRDRKIGFGHPNMRAQHALVDPVLTHGLPPGPTAHSGVDAMAQAIGACTVANSSPLSVAFGLEACHHVAGLAARGGRGRLRHGRARSALVREPHGRAGDEPLRLRRRPRARAGARQRRAPSARPHDRARPRRDARAHAGRLRGSARARRGRARRARRTGEPDGSRAVRAVRRVLADVGFPTLRDAGVTEDDLPALVASATGEQSYNLDVDCHDWTAAEVEQAFRAALLRSSPADPRPRSTTGSRARSRQRRLPCDGRGIPCEGPRSLRQACPPACANEAWR